MALMKEKMNTLFMHKRFNLYAFILIAGLILIAYSNTFHATFHFDDNPSIVENARIKRFTFENIMSSISGGRPVVELSLMLNYKLSGLNVVGWHIFNIAVHIANSMFVYLLLLQTLQFAHAEKAATPSARRMALFAALLFGVHPVQTESVTYIITRTELLATFFYLGALLLFIQGTKTGKFGHYVGAAISAVLSAGSKEWAVTLPAVVFLYDVLFISNGRIKPALTRWKAYLLILFSWIQIYRTTHLFAVGSSIGFRMTGSIGAASGSTESWTAWTYLLTSFNVIWTYLRLLFLPINQNLDYSYAVAETLFEFPTLLSFLGHVAVVILCIWMYRKKSWILVPFGVAWFYVTLSPTQSFVPVKDVIFEHRIYLPSIGIFLSFVAAYERMFSWLGKKRPETAA